MKEACPLGVRAAAGSLCSHAGLQLRVTQLRVLLALPFTAGTGAVAPVVFFSAVVSGVSFLK